MQNIQKDIRLSKSAYWLSVAAGIAVAALLIILCITDDVKISQVRTSRGYVSVEDYVCREIEDSDAPIGVKKEYIFRLAETIHNDMYLSFYTVHQYVKVWLDGKNIFSLEPSGENRISKTVGSNWVMVPIYREDAGKEIRIEITPVYESFRNREVEFLMGSELAIYRDRLYKDLPQLLLGIMSVFIGLVFSCVAGYNIYKKNRGNSLFFLGVFAAMMGFWRLTDTRFTPFIFPNNPVPVFYVSITMLMIGMVPLVKWIEEYFTPKSRRVLNCYCICAASVCLIQLLLQFMGILDVRDTLFVTHIMIGICVIVAIGIVLYERAKYPDKKKMLVGNKLPYICLAGVFADIAAFYIKGNSSGLLFSLLAFLLYIVILGIATMNNYSEQELQIAEQEHLLAEKARELAENERKLTERRIASMMSQIRSHFIFNVLTTISGYCKIDPKKADHALVRFSRYLRKNIRIIEEEGLIDFSVELEHLEDYIALEQIRFEDRILFEKEIEISSFQIPPLTIQPIVENAIKHGLIEPGLSGIVCLQTKRMADYVEITVSDNGIGFETEKCEKRESVGIRNVRYRLENMVGGELKIESVPGKGTKVTIRIPQKEKTVESNLCR